MHCYSQLKILKVQFLNAASCVEVIRAVADSFAVDGNNEKTSSAFFHHHAWNICIMFAVIGWGALPPMSVSIFGRALVGGKAVKLRVLMVTVKGGVAWKRSLGFKSGLLWMVWEKGSSRLNTEGWDLNLICSLSF